MTKYMKRQLKGKPELSVVIVSFNTKEYLENCLRSLRKVRGEVSFEVIVSDNGSTDGSVEMVRSYESKIKNLILIVNDENLGFSKGNNVARDYARGKYVLFLNSDTEVKKGTLRECVKYLEDNSEIGSLTCKIVLPDGRLDRDTRRRFPTPLVSFKRLFLFSPKDYWYLDKSEDETHEVDVIQGAFHLTRRKVLDEVGWFDEDYFLDGEDIDLCWKIKERGYKIVYYPKVCILHIKKASKKKANNIRTVVSGITAMEIFYRKHLWGKYPFYVNFLVLLGIRTLFGLRLLRYYIQKCRHKFTPEKYLYENCN